jgi:hypothetical protein
MSQIEEMLELVSLNRGELIKWLNNCERLKEPCVCTEDSFVSGVIMTMDVKTETQKNTSPQECAGCGKKITER